MNRYTQLGMKAFIFAVVLGCLAGPWLISVILAILSTMVLLSVSED